MKQRIIGIDIARAFAIIGMIIVNFKLVIGQQAPSPWLQSLAHFFEGKAAATFVVLAGVGIAFMTNRAYVNQDYSALKTAYRKLSIRALLLCIIGLSYIPIWDADILHFYGIYMLITLFFINKSPKKALLAALCIILSFPVLLFSFDYGVGWDFNTMTYTDFWTLNGFIRNLFYNGFHPVWPWVAFMLIGLWFGRQNLHDLKFVKKATLISLSVFILTNLVAMLITNTLQQRLDEPLIELAELFGTSPMPPMPLYMISGASIAITIIGFCIWTTHTKPLLKVFKLLAQTGQLALTFYVAHVVIGMGLIEGISKVPLGENTLNFSMGYALVFSLGCILFAAIWLRFFKTGPLEWILKKITG
jgi:uncharacterized membrane protein YeiB